MIYLVTNQLELFENPDYKIISVEESLRLLDTCKVLQYDSETLGLDCHIGKVLCIQFGNKKEDFQIVVDALTVDIKQYKNILENTFLIGQNLKFDLQWLYNYGIIPRKVYDTMIVEQLLYLGYPKGDEYGAISYALDAIAERRLGIVIDKSVRGEIQYTGLTPKVIKYAAKDVEHLEDIMWSQVEDCKKKGCLIGAKLECDFTPVIAYLEWCGIKLDQEKWKAKMERDKQNLLKAKKAIDDYVIELASANPTKFSKFAEDMSQNLFADELDPICLVDWNSSSDVIKFVQALGFNTSTKDKKTGEDKDTALEKELSRQKGIDDKFLTLMFGKDIRDKEGNKTHIWGYKECFKLCTTYGQGHLNAINPNTGRIHTVYRALGANSGRMSSGSKEPNKELAKLKGLAPKECKYPNMQQLPHDKITRACFIAEEGNLFCSCDYAAMEARIGAEVYNEKMLLDEFLYRSGDTHAAYAKVVFANELEGIDIKDIKKKRPDLRDKVKAVEFAVQFGSDGTAVAPQLGIPVEEARQLVTNLLSGMKGLAAFKTKGSKEVRRNGYVLMMPQTGHKMYWWDHDKWLKRQKEEFTSKFWEDYRINHKDTGDAVAQKVKMHFQAASKWDRMALNGPTQGGGAVVLKDAMIEWFNWVVDNGYFGKILLVNLTHDECNSEFPEELKDTYPKFVEQVMEKSAAKYYHKLPIPAVAEVEKYWVH